MPTTKRTPKNLLIFHLESVAWQQLRAFPEAFVNFSQWSRRARMFPWFISSATSTQMAITYLLHGNDRELDQNVDLSNLKIAGNEISLFDRLRLSGYETRFMALNARHSDSKPLLASLANILPPVEGTNDVNQFVDAISGFSGEKPVALYMWTLASHVEQMEAFQAHAARLDEQIGGAFALVDHALGLVLRALAEKDVLENTTVLIFGDHGDDYWTHGFQGGFLHGTAPYLPMIHTPLMVIDPDLAPGIDNRLASLTDVLATCNDLLGLNTSLSSAYSGRSLLSAHRPYAFAQNQFPGQAPAAHSPPKTFSVTDHSYHLMVSQRGLEFFSHRLDPGNHGNLLKYFEFTDPNTLRLRDAMNGHQHFHVALKENVPARQDMIQSFHSLKKALHQHVAEKNTLADHKSVSAQGRIEAACFQTIADDGR